MAFSSSLSIEAAGSILFAGGGGPMGNIVPVLASEEEIRRQAHVAGPASSFEIRTHTYLTPSLCLITSVPSSNPYTPRRTGRGCGETHVGTVAVGMPRGASWSGLPP